MKKLRMLMLILLFSIGACSERRQDSPIEDFDFTELMWAVAHKDYDKVKELVKTGIDVNVKNKNGTTAIIIASGSVISISERQNERASNIKIPEDTRILKILLEHGANLNVSNKAEQIPLLLAVYHGRIKSVIYLLDNNADINVTSSGNNALIYAAMHCYPDIAAVLLLYGINPDMKNGVGEDAYSVAEKSNCMSISKILTKVRNKGDGGN